MSLGLCIALAVMFIPLSASGQTQARRLQPRAVKTSSDAARRKLDRDLLQAYDRHAKGEVAVFASVVGSPRGALRQLRNGRATQSGKASLVVGSIPTQRLLKLAGDPAVLSVRPITFRRDGTPHSDIDQSRRPTMLTGAAKTAAVAKAQNEDVPYADAPPPRGSTFEQYRKLNVLDARSHNFTEAWNKGFTGEGSTAAVLDSGTDWGHPDLIGADVAEDASGWPAAFDPFGTVEWLVAPGRIDAGLSWYVRTTPKTCPAGGGDTCTVNFATRTGPSRNLPVPAGTAAHDYTFPSAWTKSGNVRLGSHPDDFALSLFEERPAFLVTDPNQAGVYDTVYVDLNDDHNFGDEKPVTRQSPRSWRDLNGDGFVDLSGGLLYYISDGTGPSGRPVPGGLEAFGLTVKGEPGELLAWTGDFDPPLGGHGTHCASNIVGQGVSNGKLPTFDDLPGDGKYPGAVVGGAPHATMVPFGDIYFNFNFSTQFAYFLTNDLGVDVTSNSYGESQLDNDPLDADSQEADIWSTLFGNHTTAVHSSGNGAPGFGTTTPASPVTGIKVGASTQFGGTGWDSIKSYRQVNDNDVANWSDRGPGANGSNGIDLVADGAYSPGSVPVNAIVDGTVAWETWGGTSRSTPVVAGATALVYQAWRAAHPGAAIPDDFGDKVRQFLKSGAKDLGYESYIQGSGSLDAGRAVRLARGKSATVTPDEWRPGDFQGQQYRAFPQLIAPGESASQSFTLDGPGSYKISDRVLRRTDTTSFDFTTSDVGNETPVLFNAPNYLIDITTLVKSHPDADLMVIRSNYPYAQFDPNDDYSADQQWRMVTYNWTDRNRDRRLFTDRDRDGTLDEFPSAETNIDGDPIPDFTRSEIQEGEYERITYINQETNGYTNMVRSPRKRMADGVFLGFYHNLANPDIKKTSFHIQVDFFSNTDWSWVSTPSRASGSFTARIRVPSKTPFGLYDGALVVSGNDQKSIVPVAVTVAAVAPQDADGNLTGTLDFGGAAVANAQRNQLYNNGSVFDAKDWGWRAESGDWRFYYFDVATKPPAGTQLLADTTWAGPSPHNDIDTLVFGKVTNSYQLLDGSDPIFAPYALGTVGGSQNTNVGAGVWLFNTATGGPEELVTAPVQQSLHAIVQHEVNMQHDSGEVNLPFTTTVGSMQLTPDQVDVQAAGDSGSFDVTFRAGIDLPGLAADGFGLSQPSVTTETAQQDDPNDPSTASVKVPFTINHAGHATISVSLPSEDIDLFVVRDANGDGNFTLDEIVAASATGSGNESVTLTRPPDGNYQVWVHGFAVSAPQPFPLTIDAVQGNDLTVSGVPAGPVPANTPVTLHVTFNKAMTSGQDYKGELLLGPSTAPTAVSVPITVHRQ